MKDYVFEPDRLQILLEEKTRRNSHISNIPNLDEGRPKVSEPDILKARKNATLDDFIAMVAHVMSKAFKEEKAEFIPNEGALIADPEKTVEHPTILYKVVSRVPKKELKARYNEELVETIDSKTGKKRYAHNWSQRQDCIVQFDVVAGDYITANKVMSIFEDSIFTYTGFFKKNGVAEMYFLKYYTDSNLDKYRQWLSVRSIQYFIEIEKLITVFDSDIEDIGV